MDHDGRRELAEKILDLLRDANEKTNVYEFEAMEVFLDLETRITYVIDDVLPGATNQIDPRPVCSFNYPDFCHECGQKPGNGDRSHGCEECKEFRRVANIANDVVL